MGLAGIIGQMEGNSTDNLKMTKWMDSGSVTILTGEYTKDFGRMEKHKVKVLIVGLIKQYIQANLQETE